MDTSEANQPFIFQPGSVSGSVGAATMPPGGPPASVVQATRREISAIIREVAIAAKREQPLENFLSTFADRIHRAMAADGVTIWLADESSEQQFSPALSIGNYTSESIPESSMPLQQNLLSHIHANSEPVFVPCTPGATEVDSLANPADLAAAIIPIELEQMARGERYVLQVFLERESGVATQRGYLRFIAQMADLAGEFLRAHRLRELFSSHDFVRKVDDAILRLHQPTTSHRIETLAADLAAEVFEFERVGLCYFDGNQATLAAANHIDEIDHRSQAARQLRYVAAQTVAAGATRSIELTAENPQITKAIVAAPENQGDVRLVGLSDPQCNQLSGDYERELARFTTHTDMALRHAARLESIPGMRWLSALSPTARASGKRWFRPLVAAIIVMIIGVAAMIPVPVLVSGIGTLRPSDRQSLTAPRDAIVQKVHVEHGQRVTAGQPLITLRDPDLDRDITRLIGRKAVLLEQQRRLNSSAIQIQNDQQQERHILEGEQQLVEEEIVSIDTQLAMLMEFKNSLVIRTDQNGIVDAWQIKDRIQGRPLRRGDHLLHVVSDPTNWIVEATIPQNRLRYLQNSHQSNGLQANVQLVSDSSQHWEADLAQLGPASQATNTEPIATSLILRMSDQANSEISASGISSESRTGAPVTIQFRCGSAPAGYLLFQDLIEGVWGTVRLYVGPASQSIAATNPR